MAAFPLIEAQEGLWIAQALDPRNPVLNTGQYLDLRGPLDPEAFQQAVTQAVAQAPALRLRFALRDGRPEQWLHPTPPAAVIVISCLGRAGAAPPGSGDHVRSALPAKGAGLADGAGAAAGAEDGTRR